MNRILPRNAQISIDIDHEPPVLVNEFYAFHLTITNDEVNKIDNVKMAVALKEGQEQFIHESSKFTFHATNLYNCTLSSETSYL